MRKKAFAVELRPTIIRATLLALGISTTSVTSAIAQNKFYNPIDLPGTHEISDALTERDIPTGQGGFARDYMVNLKQGDNLAIDLTSDSFDSIITLLAADGTTVAENDDGPDGTTNSLLFTRITKPGKYIIRVRSFGETGIGTFKLKVTKLKPDENRGQKPEVVPPRRLPLPRAR